jgi:hypothetical protein
MYKITIGDYKYIGSTKDFKQRKIRHKSNCINNNDKNYNCKVYQMIRESGGWDKCEITPIEEYECETSIQAHIREEYWRRLYDPILNSRLAYLSEEEKKEKDHIRACTNYTCECGGKYTHQNKTIHERTKKHQDYLANNNVSI